MIRKKSRRVNERFGGLEEEARENFAIYGTPEKVVDQILLYEEIGIDYLIVNFGSKGQMESLKIFAKNYKKCISKVFTTHHIC